MMLQQSYGVTMQPYVVMQPCHVTEAYDVTKQLCYVTTQLCYVTTSLVM